MRKDIQVRVHIEFVKTLDKMYPDKRSMKRKTEELNKKLMELLYAKK